MGQITEQEEEDLALTLWPQWSTQFMGHKPCSLSGFRHQKKWIDFNATSLCRADLNQISWRGKR